MSAQLVLADLELRAVQLGCDIVQEGRSNYKGGYIAILDSHFMGLKQFVHELMLMKLGFYVKHSCYNNGEAQLMLKDYPDVVITVSESDPTEGHYPQGYLICVSEEVKK